MAKDSSNFERILLNEKQDYFVGIDDDEIFLSNPILIKPGFKYQIQLYAHGLEIRRGYQKNKVNLMPNIPVQFHGDTDDEDIENQFIKNLEFYRI